VIWPREPKRLTTAQGLLILPATAYPAAIGPPVSVITATDGTFLLDYFCQTVSW
jgi:hypothetical protein